MECEMTPNKSGSKRLQKSPKRATPARPKAIDPSEYIYVDGIGLANAIADVELRTAMRKRAEAQREQLAREAPKETDGK